MGVELAMSDCQGDCETSFLIWMATAETAYWGAIAMCGLSGPMVPTCWAVASAIKALTVIGLTNDLNGCNNLCDTLEEMGG